jgi:tRNA1Val (adenine37-N6)-methyltransferase
MKVGIDGVLLGAWAGVDNVKHVLDIGTGSGLIALMIAQRTLNVHIDAIDIDEGAFKQSVLNFKNSPWNERLNSFEVSLQDFSLLAKSKYDLIVSNPPFFIDSLEAPDPKRSQARHTSTLTHKELLTFASGLLHEKGRICLILPVNEALQCVKMAEALQLKCYRKCYVKSMPNKPAHRILLELGFESVITIESSLTIELERQVYTPEFSQMLRDFYQKL